MDNIKIELKETESGEVHWIVPRKISAPDI
jgi:hypothetical protein